MAMGAACAPIVTNLVLAFREYEYIFKSHFISCLKQYLEYLDDLFTLWSGSQEALIKLLTFLEQTNDFISFTYQSSKTRINYSDVTIFQNFLTNHFKSKLFSKSSFSSCYLHFKSCQPHW